MRKSAEDDKAEREDKEDRFGPPLLADFGFVYPFEFIERTVGFLRLSNYQCWPEIGGWAEQDSALIDDVMVYLSLDRRVAWEVEHNITTSDQESKIPEDAVKVKLG